MYTLSRAPLSTEGDSSPAELAQLAMDACITHLPASSDTLSTLEQAQNADPVCSMIIKYRRSGWPGKMTLGSMWKAKGSLLLHGTQIVIPASRQQDILTKIHAGHQGIQKCRLRAKHSVWWHGISTQIENFVKTCQHCVKESTPPKEPLIPTPLPDYPWQRVASDLFQLGKTTHLIVVDYFSRYPEVNNTVLNNLKNPLCQTWDTVVGDNGPQYSSEEFKEFAANYNFKHVTSSPNFPQSNGQAEGQKTITRR